jgi:hypothetical protein
MKAINQLSNKSYEVNEYKGVYYITTQNGEVPYIILERANKRKEDIDEGHLYSHYNLNGELYSSFWTSDYKCFVKKQITLF